MKEIKHIHVFGASGAGSTTLGRKISAGQKIVQLDSDNYLWKAAFPPFGKLRNTIERNTLLDHDLRSNATWILSGSICRWGDFAIRFFDVVIFLLVPREERIKRYIKRYTQKFGPGILDQAHPLHKRFNSFKSWSYSYETGSGVYSRDGHEKWLQSLPCRVIRIEGKYSEEETYELVLGKLAASELIIHSAVSI